MSSWGLKQFLAQIFALGGGGGADYVPFQTRLRKIKYGFAGSISNVDLGMF